jgi:hypothetical protein
MKLSFEGSQVQAIAFKRQQRSQAAKRVSLLSAEGTRLLQGVDEVDKKAWWLA